MQNSCRIEGASIWKSSKITRLRIWRENYATQRKAWLIQSRKRDAGMIMLKYEWIIRSREKWILEYDRGLKKRRFWRTLNFVRKTERVVKSKWDKSTKSRI